MDEPEILAPHCKKSFVIVPQLTFCSKEVLFLALCSNNKRAIRFLVHKGFVRMSQEYWFLIAKLSPLSSDLNCCTIGLLFAVGSRFLAHFRNNVSAISCPVQIRAFKDELEMAVSYCKIYFSRKC